MSVYSSSLLFFFPFPILISVSLLFSLSGLPFSLDVTSLVLIYSSLVFSCYLSSPRSLPLSLPFFSLSPYFESFPLFPSVLGTGQITAKATAKAETSRTVGIWEENRRARTPVITGVTTEMTEVDTARTQNRDIAPPDHRFV